MEKFTKKNTRKTQKKERTLTMYNYTKSMNCDHTPQIIYKDVWKKEKKEKKYTIESVLTSHNDSCTAYLLIDERTRSKRNLLCKN